MDTSTLLVVFLLVTAASLASYALSHWSSIRGALSLGWAATSVGTTMLLVAAAIVILTFVFRGPLWRPHLAGGPQLRESAVASKETSAHPIAAAALPIAAANSSSSPTNATTRTAADRREADGSPSTSIGDQQRTLKAATTPSTSERSPASLPAFKDADPWAATRCVTVYNPGSDTTRWKIDNGCNVPVGIVVASDSDRTMLVPAKLQRPITLEEQTVYGQKISYAACFVATSAATFLIGAPSEERSTPEWRERLESARLNDACLSLIQSGIEDDLLAHYGNSVP